MEDASAKIDQVVPGTKWEFDSEVAAVFDNMLERSIPHYNVMRKSVFDLACRYVQPRTDIVDLGCSRGPGWPPWWISSGRTPGSWASKSAIRCWRLAGSDLRVTSEPASSISARWTCEGNTRRCRRR